MKLNEIKNYTFVAKLRSNDYYEIWEVVENQTKNFFTAKKIKNIGKFKELTEEYFQNELENLKQELESDKSFKFVKCIKSQEFYYIIAEETEDNTLHGLVKRHMKEKGRPLSESTAAFIFGEVFKQTEELHKRDTVHRNINPNNITIEFAKGGNSENFCLEGATIKLVEDMFSKNFGTSMNTVIGNPCYRAPEMNSQFYDFSVDYWSMGCCLFEMLIGRQLGPDETDYFIPKELSLSLAIINLLQGLLQSDPEQRWDNISIFDNYLKLSKCTKIVPLAFGKLDPKLVDKKGLKLSTKAFTKINDNFSKFIRTDPNSSTDCQSNESIDSININSSFGKIKNSFSNSVINFDKRELNQKVSQDLQFEQKSLRIDNSFDTEKQTKFDFRFEDKTKLAKGVVFMPSLANFHKPTKK